MSNQLTRKIIAAKPATYWRELLAILMLLLAFVFFRSERKELIQIIPRLHEASSLWLALCMALTILYILCQSGMYVFSFKAIGVKFSWNNAIEIFLKRNLLSVFLPAGGISSLAYTPSRLRRQGLKQVQIHQASSIYAFTGLLSIFIIGLPLILFMITDKQNFVQALIGLLSISLLIYLILFITFSIKKRGVVYRFVLKKMPGIVTRIDEIFAVNIKSHQFALVLLFSVAVELCGIFHIYFAMIALGLTPSISAAALAYIVSVLLMIASPFLRGLGAVEITLVYILSQYGYSNTQALSIAILYRIFEFWLPLFFGLFAFVWKGRQLFFRIAPAVAIFFLGIVNIISVVTPPLADRLHITREFIPAEAIHASNLLMLFIGIALIVTAAFLIKGLRNAWYFAIVLSAISIVGNLVKAFDYEEALISGIILSLLLLTARQYRLRSSLYWAKFGIRTVVLVFASVSLFGYISFYFIDKRHFGIDFTWEQSIINTAKVFLLTENNNLTPLTRFGHEFISLIRILGFSTWGFLLYSLIKPYIAKTKIADIDAREKANILLQNFGKSSVDYFKTYTDKLLFFSETKAAFIAYRIANGFAIALEEPVCADENKTVVLQEFEVLCKKMGLKPAYYRVDEDSLHLFNELKKRKIFIGQEAILDLKIFTLEGKDKKSLRNGLNSLHKKGFSTEVLKAPLQDELIAQLKNVSNEWLENFEKQEQVFSQGRFDAYEIQQQDVIICKSAEGQVVAFLNIIPDFSQLTCTYDLIRKTALAPGGCMDALIIQLIEYAQNHRYEYLNMGLVPLTGNSRPGTAAEQIMKVASEKLKRFKQFHSLRGFKEKYATIWVNKYLVFDSDFDLVQLPAALAKVMKP